MSTFKRFEEIDAWTKSRALCNSVFNSFTDEKFAKDFGLKTQMSNSSGSIMDNIAEGFERDNIRQFIQFLRYSKASCGELRSQVYRSFDRKYILASTRDELLSECTLVSAMISRLIIYLKSRIN